MHNGLPLVEPVASMENTIGATPWCAAWKLCNAAWAFSGPNHCPGEPGLPAIITTTGRRAPDQYAGGM